MSVEIRESIFGPPISGLLDMEARSALRQQLEESDAVAKLCPYTATTLACAAETIAFRECYDRHFYQQLVARHKARFCVGIRSSAIAGVSTEIFTPIDKTTPDKQESVLINLHGGGFVMGGRWAGQIESIPIAAVSGIKVVSVDYRLAPEHRFPAASQDAVAVYESLLQSQPAESIGIFGCSAGAMLTAQVVALLQEKNLPRPGAIAMVAGAGAYWGEGDSGQLHAARTGLPIELLAVAQTNPYFEGVDPDDSLAFPLRSVERLARFPPSLLLSSTRDQALSSVVQMHCRLVQFGVKASLHVWEGLDHAFQYTPELPQSQEAYRLVARFFEDHLCR